MAKSNQQDVFLRGAALLALAGLASRLLGFYRLLLPRLIGAGGVGLYHMAYPIYAAALVLATAGFPVAISKLVAERVAEGRPGAAWRVFRLSGVFLGGLGALISGLLAWQARDLALGLARDPRAYLSLLAISPAVFLVAVLSAYRGLYQGFQDMVPAARSQIIEQVVRVATILSLVLWFRSAGIAYAAAGATFGAVTGSGVAVIYLALVTGRDRGRFRGGESDPETAVQILRRLLGLALPVALAGLVLPMSQLVDLALVPWRLRLAGLSVQTATSLYGELTGYAMPLLNLAGIVATAIGISLVPAVAEAAARGERGLVQGRVAAAIRVASLVAFPAAVGLYRLGIPMAGVLFDRPSAGRLVELLAPAAIFLAWQSTAAAALQGLGQATLALRNFLGGAVLKVFLTFLLIAHHGVAGAAIGTAAGLGLTALLNLWSLGRRWGWPGPVKEILVKPALAAGIMGVALALLPRAVLLSPGWILPIGIALGTVVYGLALLQLGGLRREDLELLPRLGPWLAERLHLIGWLRG